MFWLNITSFLSVLLLVRNTTAFVSLRNPRCVNGGELNKLPSCHTLKLADESTTSLFAQKKKRRRRKNKPASPNQSIADSDEGDELPDFDLIEDIDLIEMQQEKEASTSNSISPSSPGVGVNPSSKSIDVNDPEVLAAMRSSKGAESMGGGLSTRDLIRSRNRELEERLVVNDIVEEMPSLADYTKGKGTTSGVGKKAARREARRAAAIEAEGVEPEESFLDKLPFFKKDEEKEEKSPIKVRLFNLFFSS